MPLRTLRISCPSSSSLFDFDTSAYVTLRMYSWHCGEQLVGRPPARGPHGALKGRPRGPSSTQVRAFDDRAQAPSARDSYVSTQCPVVISYALTCALLTHWIRPPLEDRPEPAGSSRGTREQWGRMGRGVLSGPWKLAGVQHTHAVRRKAREASRAHALLGCTLEGHSEARKSGRRTTGRSVGTWALLKS